VRQLADGRWGLVAEAQGSPLLDQCSFAVVDVETTGMRAIGSDRITEIAVVVVQGGRREVVLDTLINPGRPIPPGICAITNITNDMVREAPAFAELADQVLAALSGRIFVAHNARFDWNFVTAELQRSRDLVLDGPAPLHRPAGPPAGARGSAPAGWTASPAGSASRTGAATAPRVMPWSPPSCCTACWSWRAGGRPHLQDLAAIEARRTGRRARARRLAMPTPPREDSCPEAM
jgi:hypothetical protein